MLVLTRKKDQTIHIGGNVVVTVISTGRGKVKIGIEAPTSIRVCRGELKTTKDSETSENDPPARTSYELAFA